jgi:16S rRNA processing protein RimM
LPASEPNPFLAIARVVKPQGRHGEVAAEILTDFPARFRDLRRVYLENPGYPPHLIDIEKVWQHKGRVVLKFSGIDSIDQAKGVVGRHVLISGAERVRLPENYYYLWELCGCRVITDRGGVPAEVGIVTHVETTGGAALLHVARSDGRGEEVLIPLAQTICTRIDTERKTIVIDPPEDLLELNR